MSRLTNHHATLAGRMRAAGTAPAMRFADEVASLHRGYLAQRETNSRLWHDNQRLRALIPDMAAALEVRDKRVRREEATIWTAAIEAYFDATAVEDVEKRVAAIRAEMGGE